LDTIDRTIDQAIVKQLHDILVARIKSGELSPGDKILSERELCEAYHLSRTTARNALLTLENEGFVTRITGSGTYVRGPRLGLQFDSAFTGTIGFILCRHHYPVRTLREDYFYFEVMEGIHEHLKAKGGHLLTCYSDKEGEDEAALAALAGKVDGVILGEAQSERLLREAVRMGRPCVLVNPSVDHVHFDFDTFTIDNLAGAYKAVQHLVGLGHRAIGCIQGPMDALSARNRFEGYRRALVEAGIPFRTDLIEPAENWTIEQGVAAIQALIARSPGITAVFCANDTLAVGAVKGLIGTRAVPDDVSVVGFDDYTIAAHNTPALTTMRSPSLEQGRQACAQLLNRIGGVRMPVTSVLLSPDLIVRESTRSPRAGR
jgi:LacI family transcriptional regulator